MKTTTTILTALSLINFKIVKHYLKKTTKLNLKLHYEKIITELMLTCFPQY